MLRNRILQLSDPFLDVSHQSYTNNLCLKLTQRVRTFHAFSQCSSVMHSYNHLQHLTLYLCVSWIIVSVILFCNRKSAFYCSYFYFPLLGSATQTSSALSSISSNRTLHLSACVSCCLWRFCFESDYPSTPLVSLDAREWSTTTV